jgi:Holliday junction DNA helicase RuvA
MIGLLKGLVVEKTATGLILDVGGVGYELAIPLSTYENIAGNGEQAQVLTYLHVREDALQLYGFATPEEKQMFLLLISVSGIGPKLALGILSKSRVAELQSLIAGDAVAALTRLPGLGKKTAQRLVMELKDKLKDTGIRETAGVAAEAGADRGSGKYEEAVLALTSLGFPAGTAEKEVAGMLREHPDVAIDELLKRILQK